MRKSRRAIAPQVSKKRGRPARVPPEGYVSVAEAARVAGVSAPTIYYWVRLRELADVGGRAAFIREQLGASEKWVKIWILRASAEARRSPAAAGA